MKNNQQKPKSNRGVKKAFSDPQEMWDLFLEYKQVCKSNPFVVTDWVGGMGQQVERKKERPLTMEGYELYVWDKVGIQQLSQYFANRNEAYTEFLPICSRIRFAIREDQIGGGMAGLYNPSITQRLNGLVEKTESKVSVEQPLFPEIKKDDE
jgi:hypothetical protein